MTYWQARDLMNISHCGEFKQEGSRWTQVFGTPGRYPAIDNRRMQFFIKKGWVRLEPMTTQPDRIVARCKYAGRYQYVAYFYRYYRNWHRDMLKQGPA